MSYYDELKGAAAASPHAANALLFAWLCDDERRPAAYAELRKNKPVLEIRSRAKRVDGIKRFDQSVYLLTRKEDIDTALDTFSNSPYKPIGSGTFALALDNNEGHEDKRRFLMGALKFRDVEIHQIATIACFHALVGPCKCDKFDMVTDIAEQAALRFVAGLFGFPDKDHLLLQETMRRTYDGMIIQMFARHFVTEPLMLDAGNLAMGKLARRVGELVAEADTAVSTANLTAILQLDAAHASALLVAMADHAVTLNAAVRPSVEKFREQIDAPGLAQRTADLLDEILNFVAVRAGLSSFVEEFQGASAELRQKLAAFIEHIVARKKAPEERLVPKKFVLKNGKPEVPRFDEELGDLMFRETVIDRITHAPGSNSGGDLAVAVVGTLAGLMGNVIAGACIAIEQFFKLPANTREDIKKRAKATASLGASEITDAIKSANALVPFVKEALRLQPPAAFVPRMTTCEVTIGTGKDAVTIPAGSEVIVPLGAATRDMPEADKPDEFNEERKTDLFKYVFGHPAVADTSHRCVGEHVAVPLIAHIVRSVLALPDLAQQSVGDKPATLKKRWGYICESLPLRYERDKALIHRPLNVVMKVKTPVAEHAEALKLIIKSAAPAIEQLLAQSRIVHFARFVFLNGDTELGLFTTYDGAFDDYIKHFARAAGPLFDKIFEHIEAQPPMPVRNHPEEFVEHIRRFDQAPVAGYFFSAHPLQKV